VESWERDHGEGKASIHDRFRIETMQATNGEYLVRVIEVSHTVVGPFAIPGILHSTSLFLPKSTHYQLTVVSFKAKTSIKGDL
jgi:hypothetical protein